MKIIILLSVVLVVFVAVHLVNAQNQKSGSATPPSQIDKKDQRAIDGTFKEHRKGTKKGHHKKHHGHKKGNANAVPNR